jgi:ZIP family zinc transporter
VGAALGWGAIAASSLVIGAVLAFVRSWSAALIGLILAFGAGALISAVSFELVEEAVAIGSPGRAGIGLALGAATYFLADGLIARRTGSGAGNGTGGQAEGSGTSLALGSFLDGIPEQLVLGIGLAGGDSVSVALLAAIFVSNLPEGIGASVDMEASGMSRNWIIRLFVAIAVVCALASGIGYAIADSISDDLQASVNGFAAGALLVMLIDSMIPESRSKGGQVAGLIAVVGFAVATTLSNL